MVAYGPRCKTAMTSHATKNDKMLNTTTFNAMLLNLLIPAALSVASSGTSVIRLTALVKTNADITPNNICEVAQHWHLLPSYSSSSSIISVMLRISRYSFHCGSCSAYIVNGNTSNSSRAWLKRYWNARKLLT